MESDGILIYNKIKPHNTNKVTIQMSSDTSTLIPAFKLLGWKYHHYFDKREVVESQNNITFYWQKSKLATFYNHFSTDNLNNPQRKKVIKRAVSFLLKNNNYLGLKQEYLKPIKESCKLVGFYQGFPIFDSSRGLAKLLSRLGIHIDPESIMVSTPLDRYEKDVYEIAESIKNTQERLILRKKTALYLAIRVKY
ncbi:hypothetical protein HQ584_08310 [Patescibacteria group bacterium]|nr:hypothetical protein [Patescibacteria group bacterium]